MVIFKVLYSGLTKKIIAILIFLSLIFLFNLKRSWGQDSILIFAGAASKPALEEIARKFEEETKIKVHINFGGSGFVLSQMILSKKGDIYFPGSSDFMEKAKNLDVVFPETEKKVVYLVPAIVVQKGNPKNIRTLKDLTRDGIRIVIANPHDVCVGLYAVEIIEESLTEIEKSKLRKNIVNYAESCEKTATAISLKTADVAIGWRVFKYWDGDRIDVVPLKREEIKRIGYIPIAVSKFTKNKHLALKFIEFVISEKGKSIFKKFHYFTTPQEAFNWIGENKKVGGEYELPDYWK